MTLSEFMSVVDAVARKEHVAEPISATAKPASPDAAANTVEGWVYENGTEAIPVADSDACPSCGLLAQWSIPGAKIWLCVGCNPPAESAWATVDVRYPTHYTYEDASTRDFWEPMDENLGSGRPMR